MNSEREVLILEPDRLCAAVITRCAGDALPKATIHCVSEPAEAAKLLAKGTIRLFIAGIRGFDLDILTLLGVWAEHEAANTRVLVVTPEVNSTAVVALKALPLSGIFDSGTNNLRELEFAIRIVATGGLYFAQPEAAHRVPIAARHVPEVISLGRYDDMPMRRPGRGTPPSGRGRVSLNRRRY